MSRTQPRVPAGTPAGGQWAPSQHDDPGVALDPVATLARVRQSARREAGRFSLDADDVAGEALMKIYAARGRSPAGTASIRNPSAYVAKVVHNSALTMLAARRAGAVLSGQETKAYCEYGLTCAQLEQRMSRHLTAGEEDAVAEQLWRQYNRRITRDFHRRQAPLAGLVPEDKADSYAYHERRSFAAGSLADRAERVADNDARQHNIAALHEARALVWDALAEGSGAPPVARASLDRRVVTELRKRVDRAGGPGRIAAAYEAGITDEDAVCAFFAPFGELDEDGRRGVVDLVRKYPNYSDELWDAAATAATVPRGVGVAP